MGFSLTLPIKNRAAQADNIRAQFEMQQAQISLQSLQNQAELTIRQAMIGLVQGKAQIEAAHEAVVLAQQSLDAEQKKLAVGASTFYNVILRQRDVTTAQYAEIQAADAYAKALVAMDQARGTMLERNGMTFNDALRGDHQTAGSSVQQRIDPGSPVRPNGQKRSFQRYPGCRFASKRIGLLGRTSV